jgi:hypothetical protein
VRGGPDSNSTQGALFGLTMCTSGLPEALPEFRCFYRLSLHNAKEASFRSLQSDFAKTGVTRWKTRKAPLLPAEALEVTPLLGDTQNVINRPTFQASISIAGSELMG